MATRAPSLIPDSTQPTTRATGTQGRSVAPRVSSRIASPGRDQGGHRVPEATGVVRDVMAGVPPPGPRACRASGQPPTGPVAADPALLTAFGMPVARGHTASGSEPEFGGRELGAGHPGADLRERGLPGGGGVVAERREAAVVAGTQPARVDVLCRFQHPVPDLLRRLDPRVDRVGHANEYPLSRLGVSGDGTKDPGPVRFAGELDVEGAGVQAEQARQQAGVVNVSAVGR